MAIIYGVLFCEFNLIKRRDLGSFCNRFHFRGLSDITDQSHRYVTFVRFFGDKKIVLL